MDKKLSLYAAAAATAVALLSGSAARADIFEDTNGAVGDPTLNDLGTTFDGFDHLDIDRVEITNSATDLSIAITVVGDIPTTNWGKYTVGIDSAPGGDTAGNGWARPISMSSGMDAWIGSWADGSTGQQVHTYNGTSWSQVDFRTPGIVANTITLSASLSSLGLSNGSAFTFDVYTTAGGGTDGAVDAAGNPAQTIADWGEAYDSGANVLTYTITGAVAPSTWNVPGSGDWFSAGNWTAAGVPNASGAEAIFGSAIAANSTVTADSAVNVGTLRFNNASSYTIAGTGTVTIETPGVTALVSVMSGAHEISNDVSMVSNTRVDTAAATLIRLNDLSMAAGKRITKVGAGTLVIDGAMTNGANSSIAVDVGTVDLATDLGAGIATATELPDLYVSTPGGGPGAAVNLGSTQHLNTFGVNPEGQATLAAGGDKMLLARTLFVDGTGVLNMNDNDLLVDYDGVSSPEFYLRDLVKAVAQGGTSGISFDPGDGNRVIAIAEGTESGLADLNGVTFDETAVLGKYTYYGDANLDGQVTSDDYVAVDVGIGVGDSWVEGDFDFSGTVTSDDYVAIDVNLGQGSGNPLAFAELKAEMIALHTAMFGDEYVQKLAIAEAEGFAALVPEPGAMSLIGLAAAGLLGRRRR